MKDPRDLPELELLKVIVRQAPRRESGADRVLASGFERLEDAIAAAQEVPLFSGESALVEDCTGFVIYHRVGRA